jgi:hypothetical protein
MASPGGERSFAHPTVNGEDAPIPAIPWYLIELGEFDPDRPFTRHANSRLL